MKRIKALLFRMPSTPEEKMPGVERFPLTPDWGAQLSGQPRVRKVQFGGRVLPADGGRCTCPPGALGRPLRIPAMVSTHSGSSRAAVPAMASSRSVSDAGTSRHFACLRPFVKFVSALRMDSPARRRR